MVGSTYEHLSSKVDSFIETYGKNRLTRYTIFSIVHENSKNITTTGKSTIIDKLIDEYIEKN